MEFITKQGTAQLSDAAALWVLPESGGEKTLPSEAALLAGEASAWVHGRILRGASQHFAAVWRVAGDVRAWKKTAAEIATAAVRHAAVHVDLSALAADIAPRVLTVLVEAFQAAAYRFDLFKKEDKPVNLQQVIFFSGSLNLQSELNRADNTAFGVRLCKDLANTPSNVCTPAFLAQTAQKYADELGVGVTIHDAQAIQAMGMNSFWSVAKGSPEGAYLIELAYDGAPDTSQKPVVLVGKGITFDSGGISLKPGESMDEMKFDMCGAASVLGTFFAAVRERLPLNIRVLVPTCENMPAGNANKPGDVVRTLNGLTVEVLNTDAEGRLILCDALTYAERFNPACVVDAATLTGACVIALGHVAGGVLGNDQQVVDEILAAAERAGDRFWQLPLFEEYREQLQSNFADLQNIGGRPAGTITAATFLAYFAEKYPWAHLDIAGIAWKSGKEKGATGRPVAVLLDFLRNRAA